MVADNYFYQGVDGTPIGLEGMTARQTRNNFRVYERSIYDVVFHQHENTACVHQHSPVTRSSGWI